MKDKSLFSLAVNGFRFNFVGSCCRHQTNRKACTGAIRASLFLLAGASGYPAIAWAVLRHGKLTPTMLASFTFDDAVRRCEQRLTFVEMLLRVPAIFWYVFQAVNEQFHIRRKCTLHAVHGCSSPCVVLVPDFADGFIRATAARCS